MSRESTMQFADYMLSRSAFLREYCDGVEDYKDPECFIPLGLLARFGQLMFEHYDTLKPDEWAILSTMIEEGLASDDEDVGTAVATGLIEALIHQTEWSGKSWARIEADLGPLAREYADAYRNWTPPASVT